MSADPIKATVTQEGWMDEKPLYIRRYHYIRDTRALCGKYGFYMAALAPAYGGKKRAEDCAECFKRLRRREIRG